MTDDRGAPDQGPPNLGDGPPDPLARELIDDMMRLGTRTYSEVGIPMFLIAEDLRSAGGPAAPAAAPAGWRDVATLFDRHARTLTTQKPDLQAADVARLVEVFADRYIVAETEPPFGAIPEAIAERRRRPDDG